MIEVKTLATPEEMVEHGAVDSHSNSKETCLYISTVEERLFNDRFGYELYEAMLGDLIAYRPDSSGDVEYTTFKERINGAAPVYPAGSYVKHKHKIYKVTAEVTGDTPPPAADYYDCAPKFITACYQQAWDKYLCRIIAFLVQNEGAMRRLIKDTAQGLVKNYTEGSSIAAKPGEVAALKNENNQYVEKMIQNMEAWIQRTGCLPLYNLNSCESQENKRLNANLGFSFE